MRAKSDQDKLQLPDSLRQRFEQLQRRLWKVDTVIAVCGALTGLLVSYLLVFVSDRFWDTPSWLRGLLVGSGLAVSIYFVGAWLKLWVWKPRDYRSLSTLVQRRFGKLGDRLLGIVELSDEERRPPNISPALCRAAIRQVSKEAVQFDFRQAVASRKPRMYFIATVALVGILLAPWMIVPRASWNAFTRWVAPGSGVARYAFVSLEQLPKSLVVPHGEAFDVQCGVRARSIWKPSWVRWQLGGLPASRERVRAEKVVLRIPGQTQPAKLRLQAGDARREVLIEPVHRPGLRKMLARIELPEYLRHPASEEEVRNGLLGVLEGSHVTFKGVASRALSSAVLGLSGTNADPSVSAANQETLAVQNEQFFSQPLALEGSGRAAFSWRDAYGLTNAAPWPVELQHKTDAPPEVECPDQPSVVAVLEEETLDLKILARDDYGLKDLSLAWEWQKRQDTNATVTRSEVKVREGHPLTNGLSALYRFSPALLHLPPDSVVTVRAVASDYHGHRAQSPPYKILVLSQEQHAELVQQQFEKIAGELEELTRREEALEEATRETRNQPAEKQNAEETSKKIGEQAAEQTAMAEKMSQLNRMAAETMREAMRNKSIQPDTLREWTEHMQNMQSLAQSQMPQASQSLSRASQAQNNPQERQQQLQQASETEQKIVQALQEMQKKIGTTLDRMMASTLAQRLRKIARTQSDIGQDLHKTIAQTIGFTTEQLPAAPRDKGILLAANQEQAGKHTQTLTEEISRFYDRTSATNYGAVAKEMKDTDAADSLGKNADLIRKNIAAHAIKQTTSWARQFTKWAELLDAARKGDGEGSGGKGGGGQMSEAAIQRLLALLRLLQEESNIRDLTTWLEQHKSTHASYRDDAVMLSLRQSLLVDDAGQLEEAAPSKYLPEAREAMEDADDFLRKPQTDQPVAAAETDAINLLEGEIMSMFKSSQSPSQSAALAMLMEMMGMNMGQMPGRGSYAGGEAVKSDANAGPGNAQGAGAESRTADRTAGRDLRSVPAEFREALQNYYKALEQISP